MQTNTEPKNDRAAGSKLEYLTEQLLDHLETRWEYATLVFTEKASEIVSNLVSLMAAALFGMMTLLFLSLGFALWLGDMIGSRSGGFALAAVVFVPLGILAYVWIKPFVRTKIIQNILQDDDDLPDEK